MLAPSGDLLRAGIGLKVNQVKRATQSYLRDRTNRATGTVTSYAVAAGLFAAAGVFVISAVFVGLFALYRWVGLKYGMFWGFGVVGGLLILVAIVCAALAASRLRRKPPHFPTLGSRLRVAVTANPLQAGPVDVLRDNAAALMPTNMNKLFDTPLIRNSSAGTRTGLILAASLMGWALVRRRKRARRDGPSAPPG